MRRFFIFLFLFFASLFFSQCEIGKISFFISGKVEGKNKKNEIQVIDKIKLEAKVAPQNTKEKIEETSIPAEERANKVIDSTHLITLLEKQKQEISPQGINSFSILGVERPENKIDEKDKILIKEEKREELRIVKVKKLLFSKKEQQKNTNEICNADNFKILCAEKKKQNIIDKKEQFGIVTVTPRKFRARVLSLGNKENFSFFPKVTTSKNNKIIEGEKIQIQGKESAKVIELRETAKAMLKVLEEYENGYKEDLKYIQEAGLGEILQIKDEGEAISRIMELVKEKAKEERMKNEKDITKKNILDKDKIEEFMNEKDDFKCELEEINKKLLASKEKFSALKNDHLDLYWENRLLLVNQQKLKDELYNIKKTSGCKNGVEGEEIVQNIETPLSKKKISKRYKESESILDVSTRNKQPRIINSGYSMDRQIIHIQNLKEDRQSMRSSISRRMNFRSSSYSPCKNNRNSFLSFFDWKRFYTDPRQQKTFIYDNIYDISQEKVPNKDVLKEDKNVITNIKECHETSFQFQNKNAGLILNNVDENETRQKLRERENKIFKKIDIKDNKKKTRKSYGGITAGNISKDAIVRNNRTTVIGSNENVIKEGLKDFKISKLNVAKPLFSHSSFNTSNNKSTTSFSNSGMYSDKFGGKNIINNTFGQKIKIQVRNIEGRNKQLKYEDKKQKKQTEQLEEGNNTTKSTSRMDIQENSDKNVEKIKKKFSVYLKKIKGMDRGNAVQKDDKKITIHNKREDEKIQKKENKNEGGAINGKNTYQKVPQQNIRNRLKENNAGRKDTKKDLNKKVEDKKIFIYSSFRNIKKEKYTITSKNSETSNNNSNSFVSLGGKVNSNTVNEKSLKGKIFDIKKGENGKENIQEDKKVPTKTSLLTRFKRNKKNE